MPPRAARTNAHHRKKPDAFAAAVGKRIRALRDERDFTFDAFVEETGLGRGYISELERGLVVPTIHALRKVADALELTMADLVLGDSKREQLFEAAVVLSDGDIATLLKEARRLGDKRKGEKS